MARGELFGDGTDYMGTKDPGFTTYNPTPHGARYVPYEYAGFRYRVWLKDDGTVKSVEPVEGQHSAAAKQKHLMNARSCFEQETKA